MELKLCLPEFPGDCSATFCSCARADSFSDSSQSEQMWRDYDNDQLLTVPLLLIVDPHRNGLHEHGPVGTGPAPFVAAIQDPTTAGRERALSYLCLARVLDLNGNRQQAIANYQQVLSTSNFEDSHSTAEAYLKKPYRHAR